MNLPYSFRNVGPPISIVDLNSFEQELGCKLPESYRAFMLTTNGGYPANESYEVPGLPSFVLQRLYPLGGE